jgi:hypothetical protein
MQQVRALGLSITPKLHETEDNIIELLRNTSGGIALLIITQVRFMMLNIVIIKSQLQSLQKSG